MILILVKKIVFRYYQIIQNFLCLIAADLDSIYCVRNVNLND